MSFYKIDKEGLKVVKEKPMPLIYEDVKLECGYRIDLLVENKLVIEVKSVDALNDIHLAQTLTYLKLGNYKLGLLINFNTVLIKNSIKRIINGTLLSELCVKSLCPLWFKLKNKIKKYVNSTFLLLQ
ncbi:MAG: GxxExxY protein [Chitinophagales bacterium]